MVDAASSTRRSPRGPVYGHTDRAYHSRSVPAANEFGILGPLLVQGEDGEIKVSGVRRRSLLVRLLTTPNQLVSKWTLVEDVWEGSSLPTLSTLETHISNLRALIGDDRLSGGDGGYLLRVGDKELDTQRFENECRDARHALDNGDPKEASILMHRALARWRGPALLDVAGATWALTEERRLEELRLSATEALLKSMLELGDHRDVVVLAEVAAAENPLREEIWHSLILALYRSGRQADASREFQRLRNALGDVGHLPSPRLAELDRSVLQQSPDLDWRARADGSEESIASRGDDSDGGNAAYVGRRLPSGTVTLMFTDIEGSTSTWEKHPKDMELALARHYQLLQNAVSAAGGTVFKTVGDGVCAVFERAPQGLDAAITAQRSLQTEKWPGELTLRVRIGIHTGDCQERGRDYFGQTVNRVARLMSAAHGRQILVSGTSAELLSDNLPSEVSLLDLGSRRLKDIDRAEHVFQVVAEGLQRDFPPLRSDPQRKDNLPEDISSFIGRTKETIELQKHLSQHRLVTLTGSGGCGKTRLALHVANLSIDSRLDGAWLVELAPLSDPTLMARNVANVFQVREQPDVAIELSLVNALRDRDLLLVLDNCEQVVESAAELANTLLKNCPQLSILATSRQPLGVSGEVLVRVPSMSSPDEEADDPETLLGFESVNLFIERALAQQSTFELNSSNAGRVASICRRLDGIPLAIELAAARLRTMSISEIETRLDQRFRLLTAGSRTAMARQQTLVAAVSWSYDLLTEEERLVFARSSVFVGGFDLSGAEVVCAGGSVEQADLSEIIGSLVDQSLVQAETIDQQHTRYSLLETIRAYGSDRLRELGDLEVHSARAAHAGAYLDLAEIAAAYLSGAEQSEWLARLDLDKDNFRSALSHYTEDAPAPAEAMRICVALRWWWYVRGHNREGFDLVDRALALDNGLEPTELRTAALITSGALCQSPGPLPHARLTEALDSARKCNNKTLIADALCELAWLEFRKGDFPAAIELTSDAIAAARDIGDMNLLGLATSIRGSVSFSTDPTRSRADFDEAIACFSLTQNKERLSNILCRLAIHELEVGRVDVAGIHLANVLELAEELNNNGLLPFAYSALGLCAYLESNPLLARRSFEEALHQARRVEDTRSMSYAVFGLALCATSLNERAAARLHGAADALFDTYGETLDPQEEGLRQQDHQRLRDRMGDKAFHASYHSGRVLHPNDILAFACRIRDDRAPP